MENFPYPSTGLDHLDEMLTRLQYGDNVVWQVDDIAHYKELVVPYVDRAIAEHRKIVYIRFAQHAALLELMPGLTIAELDADTGFETFSTQVHQIIAQQGKLAFYVFDSLSDLLTTWATDLMVGNFFTVTCPYLYELNPPFNTRSPLLSDGCPYSWNHTTAFGCLPFGGHTLYSSAESLESTFAYDVSAASR